MIFYINNNIYINNYVTYLFCLNFKIYIFVLSRNTSARHPARLANHRSTCHPSNTPKAQGPTINITGGTFVARDSSERINNNHFSTVINTRTTAICK